MPFDSTPLKRQLRRSAKRVLPVASYRRFIANSFHRHYYRSGVWQRTNWLGAPAWKCPLDLWIYQELLYDLQPDLIIETGTQFGGSAYYLASICELLGKGRVLSIDIEERPNRPAHDRLEYILGSSTSPETLARVRPSAELADRVLVVLDSEHSCRHVLSEMVAYAPMVSRGSYLIVEDTNINGHPILRDYGPGPMEAVTEFLRSHDNFRIDPEKEKFILTFSPRGFLRKSGD